MQHTQGILLEKQSYYQNINGIGIVPPHAEGTKEEESIRTEERGRPQHLR